MGQPRSACRLGGRGGAAQRHLRAGAGGSPVRGQRRRNLARTRGDFPAALVAYRESIVLAQDHGDLRFLAEAVAGVASMDYRVFSIYNVIGGTAWIWSMLFTGYFLGRYVPGIDKYIELVIIVVIFLSILPGIIAWWKERTTVEQLKS